MRRRGQNAAGCWPFGASNSAQQVRLFWDRRRLGTLRSEATNETTRTAHRNGGAAGKLWAALLEELRLVSPPSIALSFSIELGCFAGVPRSIAETHPLFFYSRV